MKSYFWRLILFFVVCYTSVVASDTLTEAILEKDVEKTKILLNKGFDSTCCGDKYIYLASMTGDSVIVNLLIEHGATLSKRTFEIAIYNRIKGVEALLVRQNVSLPLLHRNTSIDAPDLRALKIQNGPISDAMESMLSMIETYNGPPPQTLHVFQM